MKEELDIFRTSENLNKEKNSGMRRKISKNNSKLIQIGILFLVLTCVGVIICVIICPVPEILQKANIAHEIEIELGKQDVEKKAYAEKIQDYWFNVKEGNNYLERNLLDHAQNSFTRAKLLFENGKESIYGLTKCLILRCHKDKQDCKDAIKYLDAIKESGEFGKLEVNELESLLNQTE